MRFLLALFFALSLYALEIEEYHKHEGRSNFKLLTGYMDFDNSKQKLFGRSYAIELDRATKKNHLQLFFEKVHTNTAPRVGENLSIVRGSLKYQRKYSYGWLNFFAILIEGNLAFTNGGRVFGIGWSKKGVGAYQFISLYRDFKVYQSELFLKKSWKNLFTKAIGKYIVLDKNGFKPIARAKRDYLSFGLKLHLHKKSYFADLGGFLGKRIFA